jgi:hypothetical protein
MILIYRPLQVVGGCVVWACLMLLGMSWTAQTHRILPAVLFGLGAAFFALIGLRMLGRFIAEWFRMLWRP